MLRRLAPVVLVAWLLPGPAAADPVTRIGLLFGGRTHQGRVSDLYGFGWLVGAEAGYQPSVIGIVWSVLFGSYTASGPDAVEDLATVEMDFGLRGRIPLARQEVNAFFVPQVGVTLLRTSTPLPPDDERIFLGPSVGVGLQFVVADELMISLGARYGVVTGGPRGLSLLLSLAVGSGE